MSEIFDKKSFEVFFACGGRPTLEEVNSLSHEEIKVMVEAHKEYNEALQVQQAILIARALENVEAVQSVIDGGESFRKNLVNNRNKAASDYLKKSKMGRL